MNKKKNAQIVENEENVLNKKEEVTQIEKAFVEDPLFRFIKKWQNVIFWLLILIIGGYFLCNYYKEQQTSNKREHADLFEEFRPVYANIVTLKKDIKEKELEIENAIKEKQDVEGKKKDLENLNERLKKSVDVANARIKALTLSDYYGDISKFYYAMLQKVNGDKEAFYNELSSFKYKDFNKDDDDAVKFYKELASMIVAKDYLEDKAKQKDAKDLLSKVANEGKFFNVVAYKTYKAIASRDEQEVLETLKANILKAYPEQSDLLKN